LLPELVLVRDENASVQSIVGASLPMPLESRLEHVVVVVVVVVMVE
jgi:hypothetical protein